MPLEHAVLSFLIVLIYNCLFPSSGNDAYYRFLVGVIVGVFIDLDHLVIALFRIPRKVQSAILTFQPGHIIETIIIGSNWKYRLWHPMWIGLVFGSAPLYLSGSLITVLRIVLIIHFAVDFYHSDTFSLVPFVSGSLGWVVASLIVRFASITA